MNMSQVVRVINNNHNTSIIEKSLMKQFIYPGETIDSVEGGYSYPSNQIHLPFSLSCLNVKQQKHLFHEIGHVLQKKSFCFEDWWTFDIDKQIIVNEVSAEAFSRVITYGKEPEEAINSTFSWFVSTAGLYLVKEYDDWKLILDDTFVHMDCIVKTLKEMIKTWHLMCDLDKHGMTL